MIWLGTVALKPGPCAKITWTERLAMGATCSHRSALPFNDLRCSSITTPLPSSPWRCGLLRESALLDPRLYLRPGKYVLSSPVTGPARQTATSRAAAHSRPSVASAHCAGAFPRIVLHVSSA